MTTEEHVEQMEWQSIALVKKAIALNCYEDKKHPLTMACTSLRDAIRAMQWLTPEQVAEVNQCQPAL